MLTRLHPHGKLFAKKIHATQIISRVFFRQMILELSLILVWKFFEYTTHCSTTYYSMVSREHSCEHWSSLNSFKFCHYYQLELRRNSLPLQYKKRIFDKMINILCVFKIFLIDDYQKFKERYVYLM